MFGKKKAQISLEMLIVIAVLIIGAIIFATLYINKLTTHKTTNAEMSESVDTLVTPDYEFLNDSPITLSCGNGYCEPHIGENNSTCPSDCFCGDGMCFTPYEQPGPNNISPNCNTDCGNSSHLPAPTATPDPNYTVLPGTTVFLDVSVSDANIWYTINSSNIACSIGTLFDSTSPIVLTTSTTIRAIACKPGFSPSLVSTFSYTVSSNVLSPPFAIPPSGAIISGTPIQLKHNSRNVDIRYVLDSSTPTCSSGTLYNHTHPIILTTPTTIKAIACSNQIGSAVESFNYTIDNSQSFYFNNIAVDLPEYANVTQTFVAKVYANTNHSGIDVGVNISSSSGVATNSCYFSGAVGDIVQNTQCINGFCSLGALSNHDPANDIYFNNFRFNCNDEDTFDFDFTGTLTSDGTTQSVTDSVSIGPSLYLEEYCIYEPVIPNQIWCVEDLENIQNNSSGSYLLMRDIDFKNPIFYRNTSNMNIFTTGEGFTPIPLDNGSFDGQGHSISNLYINNPSVGNILLDNIGLFGSLHNGNKIDVQNLKLVGAKVSGKDKVGSLVGLLAQGSDITNVSVVGSEISGVDYVGGLVGFSNSSPFTTISYSSSEAIVKANNYVGGFIGFVGQDNNISNCYAKGAITSLKPAAFVHTNLGLIDRCFTTLSVYSKQTDPEATMSGFVVNNNNSISNSYSLSVLSHNNILNNSMTSVGFVNYNSTGSINNSYFAGKINNFSSLSKRCGFILTEPAPYQANFGIYLQNFVDLEKTTATASYLGGATGKTSSEMLTKNTFISAGWSFNDTWKIQNNKTYPFLNTDKSYVVSIPVSIPENLEIPTGTKIYLETKTPGAYIKYTDDNTNPNCSTEGFEYKNTLGIEITQQTTIKAIACKYISGKETYTPSEIVTFNFKPTISFIEINTIEDLNSIRNNPSGKFILKRDLDFRVASSYASSSNMSGFISNQGFVPIPLTGGVFEGNGFSISNLYINRPTENNVGLFGRLDTGNKITVKNLTLSDVNITGKDYVGALLGRTASGSRITNVKVTGEVIGNDDVGGLIGKSNSGDSYITNSSVDLNVSGRFFRLGGFIGSVGQNNVVSNCSSKGKVNVLLNFTVINAPVEYDAPAAFTSVNHGTIERCYTLSEVHAHYLNSYSIKQVNLSGFVSDNFSSISNSYSLASLSQDSQIPTSLSGFAKSNYGNIENSYFAGILNKADNDYKFSFVGSIYSDKHEGLYLNNFINTELSTALPEKTFGATNKTTSEMKTINTFSNNGWDFSTIWGIDASKNNNYPYLITNE